MTDDQIRELISKADFKSAAWLLRGITNLGGGLLLCKSRLIFIANGRGSMLKGQLEKLEQQSGQIGMAVRLMNDERVTIFDLHQNEIKTKFPWYQFAGGMKVKANGALYKISFGKPVERNVAHTDNVRLREAKTNFMEAGNMRLIGKKWKALLLRD
ncbi:MAG: hypothetical protein AAF542_13195 [Pseudomonadota bacterium]